MAAQAAMAVAAQAATVELAVVTWKAMEAVVEAAVEVAEEK